VSLGKKFCIENAYLSAYGALPQAGMGRAFSAQNQNYAALGASPAATARSIQPLLEKWDLYTFGI
jgi:hypothetical protein